MLLRHVAGADGALKINSLLFHSFVSALCYAGVTVSPRARNEVVNVHTGLTDESIGGIVGALLTALIIIFAVAIFIVLRMRRRRRKYPAGSGFVDGTRNVGGAAVKCSAGMATRGGVCGTAGRSYDPAVGVVSNGNVAVVNDNGYDVTSTSDMESDGIACCGGVSGGRSIGGRGPAIEFYHVPSGRLPELPKTPDSSGNV